MIDNEGSERLQGRYALGEVIASGGMAEVFRARDEFLGRDVAIKMFRASATAESDFRRQEDEVNVVARLNHPNLVTLLDAAVDRGGADTRIYYVMELVEGTDLKRRLDEGPVVPRQIAQLGYDVATALEYVHSHGIVHRDVKPANILVTVNDDGSRLAAKLGDFGVASVGPARPISDDEVVTGTVAYLSPEQARGEEVGPASDIYALGLVLLQCFTATLAFPGPPQHSAMSRLLNDPEITESVPEEWAPLLRAMTAREARDRPDIHDVAMALRQMFAAETGRHKAIAEPAGTGKASAEQAGTEQVADDVRDGLSDETLSRITAIAARVLRTPVAIVSDPGTDRMWFTASDPELDVRTLATAEGAAAAGFKFFASAPLLDGVGEDAAVAVLCVLDRKPRKVNDAERATLRDLAAMGGRELDRSRGNLSLLPQDEADWFDSPDLDETGALITNRPSTGPVEVRATR